MGYGATSVSDQRGRGMILDLQCRPARDQNLAIIALFGPHHRRRHCLGDFASRQPFSVDRSHEAE
jgi:hypothetical protein